MSSAAGGDPELELLLAFARREDAPRVSDRLDGDRLLRLAARNGVVRLFRSRFDDLATRAVEDRVRASWREMDRGLAIHGLFLTHEMHQIVDRLRGRGVPALVFKGPATSFRAYGDPTLRPYGDLDLLVRGDDLAAVADALKARGYVPEEEEPKLARGYHWRFVRASPPVPVELHWRLMPASMSFPYDMERIWSRGETLRLEGGDVRTLGRSDALLYLCVHSAKHGWERLVWATDLRGLIETGPIDWNAVVSRAERLGAVRILALGLSLARDLAGASLPGPVDRAIRRERGIGRLAAEARSRMSRGRRTALTPWRDHLFLMQSRERGRDRLAFAGSNLRPSSQDRDAIDLPSSLHFLYYALRPLRLAWKGVTEGLRRRRD